VQEELSIEAGVARELVRQLLLEGYVELLPTGRYQITTKGVALARSTLAKALNRETANRLIEDLLARVKIVNEDTYYLYRVVQVELFGSMLTNKERPNDVDVCVTLARRFEGKPQLAAEAARRADARAGGRTFDSHFDEVCWPETEVRRFLKGRSRGLSFSAAGDPERLGVASKVIFDESAHGAVVEGGATEPEPARTKPATRSKAPTRPR
jgi:predicted nucleotidyltransferase